MKSRLVFFMVMIGPLILMSCAHITSLDQLADSNCCIKKDYEPQIAEDFKLDVRGYTKTFDLKLKYRDEYSLGITNGNIGFPWKYKFNGKLRLQFYSKNRIIRDEEVSKWRVAYDMTGKNGKDDYYREITLMYFNFPLDHKYKEDVTLRVTVVEPDTHIAEFGQEVKIVIGVSARE